MAAAGHSAWKNIWWIGRRPASIEPRDKAHIPPEANGDPNERARFATLDSVRGLASLAVVLNHCLNMYPIFDQAGGGQSMPRPGTALELILWSPLSLAWNGRGAVAIFFVLSGFVLALPWFRGRPPPYRMFVLRRFCRIYLPYAAAAALAMLLAALVPAAPPISAWFDPNWREPVTGAVLVDHILMLGAHNTFNNAVWSLNHEMRISLLFPLLLLPLLCHGLAGGMIAALALYGTAGAITYFAGWTGAPAEITATIRFSMFFVLGAMLARSAARLHTAGPGHVAWIALAAGLFCLWYSVEPAVMAIGSVLIIAAAILPGRIQKILVWPSLRVLGQVSYSLYLTHLLVLLSAVHLLNGLLPLTVIVAGAFLASFPTAYMFHRCIEAPADRLGRRWGTEPRVNR